MIIRYTQTKFQEFLLSMKRDIHVKKMLVKKLIFLKLPHHHTIFHRIISITLISIDRVFHWLFNDIIVTIQMVKGQKHRVSVRPCQNGRPLLLSILKCLDLNH